MLAKVQSVVDDASLLLILEHSSKDSIFIPDEVIAAAQGANLMSADIFDVNPLLAWSCWSLIINAQPARPQLMPLSWSDRAFVVTSSPVGSADRWGSRTPICELHGSIRTLQCTNIDGDCTDSWPVTPQSFSGFVRDPRTRLLTMGSPMPKCPQCGALARPNMLFLGDSAWSAEASSLTYDKLGQALDNNSSSNRGGEEAASIVVLELNEAGGSLVPSVEKLGAKVASRYAAAVHLRVNCGQGDWDADDGERTLYLDGNIDEVLGALTSARDTVGSPKKAETPEKKKKNSEKDKEEKEEEKKKKKKKKKSEKKGKKDKKKSKEKKEQKGKNKKKKKKKKK